MRIQIAQLNGETVNIDVDPSMTLFQALEENKIKPRENHIFNAVSSGKVLSMHITIETLGIKENQKVYLSQKRTGFSTTLVDFPLTKQDIEDRIQSKVLLEKCYLADLGFNSWECDPRFPLLVQELYEDEQLAQDEEEGDNNDIQLSVVSNNKQMSDQPLPYVFILSDCY